MGKEKGKKRLRVNDKKVREIPMREEGAYGCNCGRIRERGAMSGVNPWRRRPDLRSTLGHRPNSHNFFF